MLRGDVEIRCPGYECVCRGPACLGLGRESLSRANQLYRCFGAGCAESSDPSAKPARPSGRQRQRSARRPSRRRRSDTPGGLGASWKWAEIRKIPWHTSAGVRKTSENRPRPTCVRGLPRRRGTAEVCSPDRECGAALEKCGECRECDRRSSSHSGGARDGDPGRAGARLSEAARLTSVRAFCQARLQATGDQILLHLEESRPPDLTGSAASAERRSRSAQLSLRPQRRPHARSPRHRLRLTCALALAAAQAMGRRTCRLDCTRTADAGTP